MDILLVAIGGFFGGIARFSIALLCKKHPISTWIANITGSIMLAIIFRLFMEQNLPEFLWILGGIGFCGAFTTFSTFGNELIEMMLAGKYSQAVLYAVTTLVISLSAVFIVFLI